MSIYETSRIIQCVSGNDKIKIHRKSHGMYIPLTPLHTIYEKYFIPGNSDVLYRLNIINRLYEDFNVIPTSLF